MSLATPWEGRDDLKRLTTCPACDVGFEGRLPAYHIADHDPEDFGL